MWSVGTLNYWWMAANTEMQKIGLSTIICLQTKLKNNVCTVNLDCNKISYHGEIMLTVGKAGHS